MSKIEITPITDLPTPPQRTDRENFRERADTFLAALPTFQTETNDAIGEMNKITSGLDQATPIDAWEGTPTSYDFPDVVAGSDGNSYRCLGTNVVDVDPTTDDGTNWFGLSIPSGVITMWSGAVGAVPAGWALCNGSNGTPDLRDRFVIGAGGDRAVGTTSDGTIPSHSHASGTLDNDTAANHTHTGPSHTHTGPSHRHTGPSHTHGSGTIATNSTGAHQHTQRRASGTALNDWVSTLGDGSSGMGNRYEETTIAQTTNRILTASAGAHSHSVSGSTASGGTGNTGYSGTGNTGSSGTANTGSSGSHSHTISGSTATNGSGAENIAKYYALAYIMKL